MTTVPTGKRQERAVAVGVVTPATPPRQAEQHLEELASLAKTAGIEVVDRLMQRRPALDPTTLVGKGKLAEIAALVKAREIDLVLFDTDISGSQAKNISEVIPVQVLDRSGLILDIFARNARTAEAKLQVEVAQLEYMLPRLTRAWTHLSRQDGGGAGAGARRGPGETQLETDRRAVRRRIGELKEKLRKQEGTKSRQNAERWPTFHATLVGYTNAGKSSLMNRLTRASVKVEDKLFSTLDATTRRIWLAPGYRAVLSDTVGFIRKLPHHLIESFRSTLSVVAEASLILHVVDASEPELEEHMEVTAETLTGLATDSIPRLLILNKIDLVPPEQIARLQTAHPDAVLVSATSGAGVGELVSRLRCFCEERTPAACIPMPGSEEWEKSQNHP